jgi:hypothetical protein
MFLDYIRGTGAQQPKIAAFTVTVRKDTTSRRQEQTFQLGLHPSLLTRQVCVAVGT